MVAGHRVEDSWNILARPLPLDAILKLRLDFVPAMMTLDLHFLYSD